MYRRPESGVVAQVLYLWRFNNYRLQMNQRMLKTAILLLLSLSLLEGINAQEDYSQPQFELLGPETNILFSNDIEENETHNIFRYEYFYNGGGVSIGDINNDNLPDIYLTGNMVEDRLYLNKGNMKFEDITSTAILSGTGGWHTGTTMADVNGDGYLDIYVCRSGDRNNFSDASNLLYINNGDLTFTERSKEFGLNDTLNSTQASFFDFDLDGDLDVYVMNVPKEMFVFSKQEYRDLFVSGKNNSDHLYRNDNGVFKDISKEAGVNNHAFGLGLGIGDLDNNGWPDIYVANDYEDRDYMFMNHGGKFKEELKLRTHHVSNFGMGVDISDFNNDGHQDIVELDMAYATHERSKRNMASMSEKKFWTMVARGNHYQYMVNTLQLNNGNATFSEIGQLAGIAKTDWSWGALFADFDNDGYKDLVITNGQHRDLQDRDFQNEFNRRTEGQKLLIDEILSIVPSSKQSNYLFRNKGDYTFENCTNSCGFDKKVNSNGVAYGDLDNDGDLDLVVNNLGEEASVYRNMANNKNNYIVIQLKGKEDNIFAYGAKVTLYYQNGIQVQELYATRGYQSSVDPKLYFGLGNNNEIDKIEIRWPDNKISVHKEIEPNKRLVVDYYKCVFEEPKVLEDEPLFKDLSGKLPIKVLHRENAFNDFEREILLPHALSNMGPSLAVGDINDDGLDDVFVGAAKGEVSGLFRQIEGEPFVRGLSNTLALDSMCEDVGALFFDADGDGDEDLYVASGGNDYAKDASELQDRLYINNGIGEFTKAEGALPLMISSTKVVKSADFDADGDLDLFVGGRLTPGEYPVAPRSYLLKNENGKFHDATAEICKDLMTPGMVTGAEFTDINGDGKIDLTLVGEWMGLTRFINYGDTFVKHEVMEESEGLWFSLLAADFDKDGDMDFVGGNLGRNAKFKASMEHPFNVYGNDFDENGSFDLVLSTFQGEINYPVRGRECSSQQMPFITEICPTYKDFAEADMSTLYGNKLDASVHLTARNLYSCIFLNDGKGNFEMKKLPMEAQFSPIMGMVSEDINMDGNIDLIVAGNMYEAEVETVRYDAGRGACLLGDGNGNFTALSPEKSGFFAWHNVKSMVRMLVGGSKTYLLGINQSYPQVFILNP